MTNINPIQIFKLLLVIFSFTLFIGCDNDDDSAGPIKPTDSAYYDFGPYQTITEEITDDSFNPTLRIHRPVESVQETYPLVLFQQGANTPGVFNITTESYDLYTKHLASYGYVLVTMSLDVTDGPTLFTDVNTVYDWIKTQTEDSTTWWSQYTDISKTIVGGHSFGGVTASQILSFGTEKAQAIVYFASFPGENESVPVYEGKVLSIAGGEEVAFSTPEETRNGYDSFDASSCRNYVLVEGLDHGGFGDYEFAEQPVGSIGRANATATIRHYFVSFLEANFKNDQDASEAFYSENGQPTTTAEFINEGC